MRQVEPGGAEPDHQHLVARSRASATAGADRAGSSASAGCRSRSPRAGPARPSACGSRSAGCRPGPAAGRCRTSCSRCRCGARSRRRAGCRPRRWRARRAELPRAIDEVHLGDLLVERAAGEGDAEDALPEAAVLVVQPAAAAVLLLVVAPDAVIRLVLRAGEVGAADRSAQNRRARRQSSSGRRSIVTPWRSTVSTGTR